MSNPFDFFSGIYCVNLDTRADRWHDSKNEFYRLGIRTKVKRFPGIIIPSLKRTVHVGRAGCFSSFRAIVSEAKENKLENVLIFEDDVQFTEDALDILSASIKGLSDTDWKMFYLGTCITNEFSEVPLSRITNNLLRMRGGLCHHATAYHHSIYDKVLEGIPDIDTMYLWLRYHESMERWLVENIQLKHEVYCVNPMIATQRPSYSDIDGRHRDLAPRLIEKFNSFVKDIK